MAPSLRLSVDEAAASWALLIRAAADQFKRLAEESPFGTETFRAARLPAFRPGVSVSEELEYLRSLARPADVWMDIGAGAGRLAIPLARSIRRMIAVEPSPTMRVALLEAAAAESGGGALEVHDRRWPDEADHMPVVDVTLAANLLYSVDEPLSWVDAMERRSRRLCVVTLADRPARAPDEDVWLDLMGEPLIRGPGAPDFVALLLATGRRVDVRTFLAPAPRPIGLDEAVEAQRWRCGLREESPRLPQLRDAVRRRADADGLVRLRAGRGYTAVVTWEPRQARSSAAVAGGSAP
ncbi:MAG TPA: hypothetical protein VFC93_19700 [Chloroflexota bacterium]|nr:hypothetical protein [Chloroflexota bacterium]